MSEEARPTISLHPLEELTGEESADLCFTPGADFFSSLDWFRCLAEHGLGGSLRPLIITAGESAADPALLFAVARGQNLASLTSFYTPRFSPMQSDEASLCLLAEALYSARPRWSVIELRCLPAHIDSTGQLATALAQAGFSVDRFFQYGNHVVDTQPGNSEAYFAARPGQLRNTLERKLRRAHAEHRVGFEIIAAGSRRLDRAIDAYLRVYRRSWKREEAFPDFMPALIRLAARLGIARLGLMSLDDQPVAAQFWITSGPEAMIYKLAHDQSAASLSVGTLLSAAMFRHAIDQDRVSRIDFGIGDEPYKRDWMDQRREIIGIEALHPATAAGRLRMTKKALRNGLRRAGLR